MICPHLAPPFHTRLREMARGGLDWRAPFVPPPPRISSGLRGICPPLMTHPAPSKWPVWRAGATADERGIVKLSPSPTPIQHYSAQLRSRLMAMRGVTVPVIKAGLTSGSDGRKSGRRRKSSLIICGLLARVTGGYSISNFKVAKGRRAFFGPGESIIDWYTRSG